MKLSSRILQKKIVFSKAVLEKKYYFEPDELITANTFFLPSDKVQAAQNTIYQGKHAAAIAQMDIGEPSNDTTSA